MRWPAEATPRRIEHSLGNRPGLQFFADFGANRRRQQSTGVMSVSGPNAPSERMKLEAEHRDGVASLLLLGLGGGRPVRIGGGSFSDDDFPYMDNF